MQIDTAKKMATINSKQNSDVELWKNTNYNSDIYTEMNAFRNLISYSEYHRKEFQIREQLEKSVAEKNIDLLLLYLNEYEILFGADNKTYKYYENIAAPLYDKMLKAANRPRCKFFDGSILNITTQITSYKDLHKGERCFIIGNGPSLNKIDLTKLKDEITFGVNSIFLNYDKMGFNPTYYTVEDYHVINERADAIKNITGSIKFIPQYAYSKFGICDDFVYINVIPDYRRYKGYPFFSTAIHNRAWTGGTVSYINIQLAYYMGFKTVYLVGFDHNYIIPDSAKVSGVNIVSTEDDPNHFHPDYFGKGFSWHIPLTERMELCYIKSKYAFEQSGRTIINATKGGCLEVFPRQDFTTIIAQPKPIPPAKNKNTSQERAYDITVVVPAYNAEETLVRTLESVIRQHNIYCEIIIVDDGSTDGTAEIAKEYTRKFKNISLIQQDNKGLGGARNTGMLNATADYITFVDSDDTLTEDILYQSLQKQKELDADIIMFDYARIENGKDIKGNSNFLNSYGIEALFDLFSGFSLAATCRIYKKSLLINNAIAFPEHRYHEDILFTLKSYYHARKVSYINKKGYNWIFREGSITSHITEKHLESMYMNLHELKTFLDQEAIYNKLFRRYLVFCFRMSKLMAERIYKITDIDRKTILLRKLRNCIEDLDLDFYEYIQIAKSNNREVVQYVFDRLFYTSAPQQPPVSRSVSKPGKPQPSRAISSAACEDASQPAHASLQQTFNRTQKIICGIIKLCIFNKNKRKKFNRNPRLFFEDARFPFTMLKHIF